MKTIEFNPGVSTVNLRNHLPGETPDKRQWITGPLLYHLLPNSQGTSSYSQSLRIYAHSQTADIIKEALPLQYQA